MEKSSCKGKASYYRKTQKEAAAEGESIDQENAEHEALKGRIGKQFKKRGSKEDPGEMADFIKNRKSAKKAKGEN